MTMQELLEEDRERLMTELSQAGDAQAALPVLNRELERLQFRYHEQCEDRKELEQVHQLDRAEELLRRRQIEYLAEGRK